MSNDEPEVQRAFALDRGWKFKMASAQGTTLGLDLGMQEDDSLMPGVSAFVKRGNTIQRVSLAGFGPGDVYSAIWQMLDLFPGTPDWSPKFTY